MSQFAIEHGLVEIVDLPINMVIFHGSVSLPKKLGIHGIMIIHSIYIYIYGVL